MEVTDAFSAATAPVWLSTETSTGQVVKGLQPLKQLIDSSKVRGYGGKKRPIVFVGYHQRLGIDVGLLLAQFYREFGVCLRGLAHPEVMNNSAMKDVESTFSRWFQIGSTGEETNAQDAASAKETAGDTLAAERRVLNGAVNDLFTKFGAVEVTARNYVRLLQEGENILLFPGGVREAFHCKGEDYQLFWPESTEFIRAAAKFDAVVVPFAAVGAAESLPLILDQQELEGLPVIGENLRRSLATRAKVRQEEWFSAPLAAPMLPERFYFLFGKPIDLSEVDRHDRSRCEDLYGSARAEVERCIRWLLDWRKRDPYREALPRWAYQARHLGEEVPIADL